MKDGGDNLEETITTDDCLCDNHQLSSGPASQECSAGGISYVLSSSSSFGALN